MKIKDYKDLEVWKKGIEIVDEIYHLTNQFPTEEKYGLGAHMRKTAISIPSNIAEGFARKYLKEYRRFLFISLGSCSELETQTVIAKRRTYAHEANWERLKDYLDHESRMLMNLAKSLRT